jgi:hypothetical protein
MEMVDILAPPDFAKTGQIKSKTQALKDGDWLGVFNVWLIQDKPLASLVYQQRSPTSRWGPNLLDVTVGGYYQTGETIKDGLREIQEEIGRFYSYQDLTYLGKKLFFGTDIRGNHVKSVVDTHLVKDNTPLEKFTLDPQEVFALVTCPINKLIKLHTQKDYTFTAQGIDHHHQPYQVNVTLDLIPYNWDNYHYKIALLADRFIQGEKDLLY